MKQIQLGKTNVQVSKLGLGTWAIGGGRYWGDNDDDESIKTIHAALECGFNIIDTAPNYGFGHSEEIVGKAMKGKRDQITLSTKCGLNWDENRRGSYHSQDGNYIVHRNLTPESIQQDLENSLRRLQTDYIDLYITHWQAAPEFPVPIEDTMGKLMELKKQGKIRAIGASNVTEEIIEEYCKFGQLDVIQERYSMLDRRTEKFFELCKEKKITIMAYSPLEQGLLTGKYPRDFKIPGNQSRLEKNWYQPENLSKLWDMMEQWNPLCEKYKCNYGQLAIAWTAAQADNLLVLNGARKVTQAQDNAKGGEIILSKEDVAYMKNLLSCVEEKE